MGLLDFLKVKKDAKKPAKGKPQVPSKGTATFSGHSFPVIEWNTKRGFNSPVHRDFELARV